VSVALFARQYFVQWLVISVSLLVFVESSFRGQITRLVTSVTIALAIVTALILIYEFFWYIVAVFVFVIGIYLLWDNLRELWK
jgi:hypothetical protein